MNNDRYSDYYNTREHCFIDEVFLPFFNDFYKSEKGYTWEFMEWVCQENLIGQELTEEIYVLWELSKVD